MSINHAFHIEKLKTDFENIITLKKEIAKIKSIVSEKLSQLKIQYNELVKTNSKKIFLFCLDSFYFQYKTFAMELEHIDRFRSLMNNRMYCDYYKLYNIIIAFIKENRTDLDIDELEVKSYPTYKDLEPFQEYKLEDIKDIHSNILVLINKLYLQLNSKVDSVDHYNETHKIGFSISNFLNTLEYENRLLKEQISLYINYVSFFHISEKRQLNRLFMRMQEFYKEIDENIKKRCPGKFHDTEENRNLSISFYHKNKSTKDGFATYCKDCARKNRCKNEDYLLKMDFKFDTEIFKWCPGPCHDENKDRIIPKTHFNKNKASICGLTSYCKECEAEKKYGKNRKIMPIYKKPPGNINIDIDKWCQLCETVLERKFFHSSISTYDGLQNGCIHCRKKMRKIKKET